LSKLGYSPLGPYLDKEKGTSTQKYGIVRRKDYLRVALAKFGEVQDLLRRVPIRHSEKILRRNLALSIAFGQSWASVVGRVESLRNNIRKERDESVREAESDFRRVRSHGRAKPEKDV